MRFIEKQEESPPIFQSLTKKPFRDWSTEQKTQAKQSLMEEQHFICCYCEMRISLKESHVEHFKPKSQYPEEDRNYYNLLASCQRMPEVSIPRHCGHLKANWYEEKGIVSPLLPNCQGFFAYTADGQILPNPKSTPHQQNVARITIEKLGLNIEILKAQRSAAIDAILLNIDLMSNEDIVQLINEYDRPDKSGMYEPFCSTIIYILNRLSKSIQSLP